jgi:sigma-E factor negative regulatory protein RseA
MHRVASMNTAREELLSAFVDEEASELEVPRLCRELLGDERALAQWSRYHLIRDALRGNLPVTVDADFAARVMSKVREQPLYISASRREWRLGLLKPAMGFGLAASIAVVCVLTFQSLNSPSATISDVMQLASGPGPAERAARQVSVHTAGAADASSAERSLDQNPEVAARLDSYLVNHGEYAPSQGMMPYARVVVGYESD